MSKDTVLALSVIRRDGGTQPRDHLSMEVAKDYAEAIAGGATLPPVIVFHDGTYHWLADGFHRTEAAVILGWTELTADIRQGTRRDAILYSVGANADHGYRRSQADKRRAILVLLNDPEWSAWSDREISRRCSVSPSTVATLRPAASLSNLDSEVRTYTTRHGRPSTMKVGEIGKAQKLKARAAGHDPDGRPVEPDESRLDSEPATGEPPDRIKASAPVCSGEAAIPCMTPAQDQIVQRLFDLLDTIAGLGEPGTVLTAWSLFRGQDITVSSVVAARNWLTAFAAEFPAVEQRRQAAVAAMLERIDADVIA